MPHATSHKSDVKSKEKNTFDLARGGEEFKLYFVEDTKFKYTDLIGEG